MENKFVELFGPVTLLDLINWLSKYTLQLHEHNGIWNGQVGGTNRLYKSGPCNTLRSCLYTLAVQIYMDECPVIEQTKHQQLLKDELKAVKDGN